MFSNWQAKDSLDNWARQNNLPVIYNIDTRSLAVYLRQKKEMFAAISTSTFKPQRLSQCIEKAKNKTKKIQWLKHTSCKQITSLGHKDGPRFVVLDLGVSRSFIKALEKSACDIVIVPFNTKAETIQKLNPKALLISNGPEVNGGLKNVALTVKSLLGQFPIVGISTGAQVLALSLAPIKTPPL